jgi:alkanesulfonate monooxygenase SsuD/methylene tetrahydromethanopterin reductase-like flavin-dependent oxidoreductase (luciferase family)
MITLATLRARLAKLEARAPSPVRRFIVVAGTPDQIAPALVAALEAKGEVVLLTSGVPRDPLDEGPRQPVVYEQVGGAWISADEALAA